MTDNDTERQQRLREALRENLKRRKTQLRQRSVRDRSDRSETAASRNGDSETDEP